MRRLNQIQYVQEGTGKFPCLRLHWAASEKIILFGSSFHEINGGFLLDNADRFIFQSFGYSLLHYNDILFVLSKRMYYVSF